MNMRLFFYDLTDKRQAKKAQYDLLGIIAMTIIVVVLSHIFPSYLALLSLHTFCNAISPKQIKNSPTVIATK